MSFHSQYLSHRLQQGSIRRPNYKTLEEVLGHATPLAPTYSRFRGITQLSSLTPPSSRHIPRVPPPFTSALQLYQCGRQPESRCGYHGNGRHAGDCERKPWHQHKPALPGGGGGGGGGGSWLRAGGGAPGVAEGQRQVRQRSSPCPRVYG